jgi:hypothetical protein
MSAIGGKADIAIALGSANDSKRTCPQRRVRNPGRNRRHESCLNHREEKMAMPPGTRKHCAATAHGPYFKVAPLPRDRFALQSGKQFGVMSVDILAEIRNAVIDPGCQIRDVNG